MESKNEVAAIIEKHLDDISLAWVESVKRNVTAAKDQSNLFLINHLNDFFTNLITALRKQDQVDEDATNIHLSKEHGRQRSSDKNYSIDQVIQEYHLLRTTIFDFMDDKVMVRRRERNIINEFIDDFIRMASATFSEVLNLKLVEALRLRDEFIATISHELKTPLTSMKLRTQISKRNIVKEDKKETPVGGVIHLIDQNEKGINRLHHLVDDMLDISKINSGKLFLESEDFVLADAVDEVLKEMRGLMEENHCHVIADIPENIHLHCDKYRVEQILVNLLSNAAKYGAGGDIELHAHVEEGKEITLEVQDHGRGIDEKDQERIFERFERVSRRGERNGLGLGLYIVKNLTHMLGGDIQLKSKPGQGSNFILHLPLQ